ncbi:Transcription factor MYBS3 [Camellia lanceoleosa]|uniref:Transcription factor MYBS3 n=1 Tax=Camellia lanceoleosa TaxID=1840588 RepID=A0ACC0G2T3_9ERIC|nr:Transcription factor MYBS3 [Camellia lanceoleosa]
MGRKCSHCGNIGHNSRTCITHNNQKITLVGGLKLFGVQLHISSSSSSIAMKKSSSMDCFPASSSTPSSSSSSTTSLQLLSTDENSAKIAPNGYLSEGLVRRTQERKKGVPWSEEEHRIFLVGLEKLGKGDWRGISRNFVTTRTPTQVASHAQKYFLRQISLQKNKRRPSLFDESQKTNGCSVMDFHSHEEQASKASQPSMPVWLHGSIFESQTTVQNQAPDLELKLAAPRPLNQQSKSPSRGAGLFAGPISVV